jgi:tetratricopeptide (TPR) repeat protein
VPVGEDELNESQREQLARRARSRLAIAPSMRVIPTEARTLLAQRAWGRRKCCMIMQPLLAAALLACGPRQAPLGPRLAEVAGADAPYEIASDADLAALRDRYFAMPLAAAARAARRAELAAEHQRRAERALSRGDRGRAFKQLTELLSLWDGRELRAGNLDLEARAPLARAILESFSSSGGDIEAATALYVLIAASGPEGSGTAAAPHFEELDLLFGYSDELAVAEYGEGAERSRPIAILEAVVKAFPSPVAIKRLDRLYRGRQAAIDRAARAGKLSYELIGAHGDGVIRTAWHLACAHARGGDVGAALPSIARLAGIGEDPELTGALVAALAGEATPKRWIALATAIAGDDEASDETAALATLLQGLARFPRSRSLRRAAGMRAGKLDRISLAIRLLEGGLGREANAPLEHRAASVELGELYEFRVTQLASAGRPRAAAAMLATFESFYADAADRWPDFTPDLANAYAALGRGMVGLGELGEARRLLDRSLARRPTLEALEYLGTLALRRDRFAEAAGYFERALALPAPDPNIQFNHNKLMRLAGEARAGAGQQGRAVRHYLNALAGWERMRSSKTYELRAPFAADALIETGKLLWHLGKRDEAMAAFAAGIDAAPGNGTAYAAVVSFLVVRDRYDEALDAYHRALGSSEVSDYFKVYMSLWVVAEARRAGHEIDPFARDYLADRDGRLWHDELARFATGRVRLAGLEKRATTRGRRAELLYYRAVLAETRSPARTRSLLEDVIDSQMVMFFEYEMAKHWLEAGFVAR